MNTRPHLPMASPLVRKLWFKFKSMHADNSDYKYLEIQVEDQIEDGN